MKQLTLLDLPGELISNIVDYLPDQVLNEFKKIPQLSSYAYKVLFKDLVVVPINYPDPDTWWDVGFQNGMLFPSPTKWITIDELIIAIKDGTARWIRSITFEDQFHIFLLHDWYPSFLKSVKITIDLTRISSLRNINLDKETDFHRLAELPYEIVAIHSVLYDASDIEDYEETSHGTLNEDLHDKVQDDLYNDPDRIFEYGLVNEPQLGVERNITYDSDDDDPVEEVYGDSFKIVIREGVFIEDFCEFKHLKSLHVSHLYGLVSSFLPSNLQDLKINKFEVMTLEIPHIEFPMGLSSLSIEKFVMLDSLEEIPVDISYLKKLESLECEKSRNFKLPRTLKSIRASRLLDLPQIVSQCPSLKLLDCREHPIGRYEYIYHNEDIYVEFPNGMEELNVHGEYLLYLEPCLLSKLGAQIVDDDEFDDGIIVIRFPKMLKKLHIFGLEKFQISENSRLFSNCEEIALNQLTSLTLERFENRFEMGLFPRSLRELKLLQCSGIDFGDLKNLNQLTSLLIYGTILSFSNAKNVMTFEFDYDLPDSLVYFGFDLNPIHSFKIRAKNLQYLEFNMNKLLKVLSGTNFEIPETIIELNIRGNALCKIETSFKFPPRLKMLDLSYNQLNTIPQLPSSLLKLSLIHNNFGGIQNILEFPPNLEILNLSRNKLLPDFDASFLNLQHHKKLKILLLSEAEDFHGHIKNLNLEKFPKSLISLSLRNLLIEKLDGSFADFSNLENLYVQNNPSACTFFDMKQDPLEYPYLPDTIKCVAIFESYFLEGTFDKFVKMVKAMPNFEIMIVGKHIPDSDFLTFLEFRTIRATGFEKLDEIEF